MNEYMARCIVLGVLLLPGCTRPVEIGPEDVAVDRAMARAFAADSRLPFQFPLEDYDPRTASGSTSFSMTGTYPPDCIKKFQAAEDCYRPAGTPVYAMANGCVSFSGPAGGYGWLIVIDHPLANLYSLYGHVSPSRWRITSGTVTKGALIGHLGGSKENSGTTNVLPSHLHFGVRAGQRADYPDGGDWRWQAGWVKGRPQDLGWLQPSAIVASQHIPPGGYRNPRQPFLDLSWSELLAITVCALCCACMLVAALRRKRLLFLVFLGAVLVVAGFVLNCDPITRICVLSPIGAILLVVGLVVLRYRRQCHEEPGSEPESGTSFI
jgi:hypothetical protein